MNHVVKTDLQLGYAALRIATGVNLFGHGLVRLAGNMGAFEAWMVQTFADSLLPPALVRATAYAVPPAELLIGALLVIGLRTREALLAASGLITLLIFGACLIQRWDVVGLQMIYAVVYAALLSFRTNDAFGLDWIRAHTARSISPTVPSSALAQVPSTHEQKE